MLHVPIHAGGAAPLLRDADSRRRLARHARVVGALSGILARRLGLDEQRAGWIARAGALHDIGKNFVATAILDKPAALDKAEMSLMRLHPELGHAYLAAGPQTPVTVMAAQIALQHHERIDGSGYPFGKRGEDIALPARIVAVADTYAALREVRPYKPAGDHAAAVAVISANESATGTRLFDPLVVGALAVGEAEVAAGFGQMVKLIGPLHR